MDPDEALHALTTKWILEAMTLGFSNLQLLLRYKILQIRPQERGTWPAASQWILSKRIRTTQGSRAWDRIIKTWRKINRKIEFLRH